MHTKILIDHGEGVTRLADPRLTRMLLSLANAPGIRSALHQCSEEKRIQIVADLILEFGADEAKNTSATFLDNVCPGTALMDVSPQIRDTPVDHLPVSIRVSRAFEILGLKDIGDLLFCSTDEFLELPNFGPASLRELERVLTPLGVQLGSDDDQRRKYTPPDLTPEIVRPMWEKVLQKHGVVLGSRSTNRCTTKPCVSPDVHRS